jgi:two-component system LytT family response regulator
MDQYISEKLDNDNIIAPQIVSRCYFKRKINKILLIESDEESQNIISLLSATDKYDIRQTSSGEEALRLYKTFHPELIICNINMVPEIVDEIQNKLNILGLDITVPFFILSDKPKYAEFRRAMELGADDYICKPYSDNDFKEAIRRVIEKYDYIKNRIYPDDLQIEAKEKDNIVVRYCGKMIPIAIKDIQYISIEGQYSKIFIDDTRHYTIKKALCKWEQILPQNMFLRIHRTTMVNINKVKEVKKINNNIYQVQLHNSCCLLELSRRYFKNFKKYTVKS